MEFSYDRNGKLITISYEYDAPGNRTKKIVEDGTVTTTDYSYDAANQLTAVDGQAYSYDQNGNLTANGEQSFVYNEKNRLIEVKDSSDQTIASFTYNHKGKRKSKTTASGTVYYHYNKEGKLTYETDDNNNIVREYTYDAQGNPATMTQNSETYYYHVNGHGDVMSLTDSSGAVVAEYNYDAWGNIISQSGSMASENPHRYAGYYYDESTELYYLNARYYDAEIGRFITRDTFHGFEDDPQSLNKYAYCKGNPVMNVDPNGNFAVNYHKRTYVGSGSSYSIYLSGWISNWGFDGSIYAGLYYKLTRGGMGIFATNAIGGILLKKAALAWTTRNLYLKEIMADIIKITWISNWIYKKLIGKVQIAIKESLKWADGLIMKIPYATTTVVSGWESHRFIW